ncbi:MAG: NAD-dependent protein deacylase [Acidimicrobiia bacterium]
MLSEARHILVFTGAGISTESGIPDFRGPNGVWTRLDPSDFTYDRYLTDPEIRRRSWQMRHESGILDAVPNPAHHAVVRLWKASRLIGCVTQNIDGLHQEAGLPQEAVVELHGNARETICVQCDARQATTRVLERVDQGEEDPHCLECGGILKAAVVYFGELMPEQETASAFDLAERADAVIAVGSTLSVYPAAYVPLRAQRTGAPLVIINLGPTDHDALADVRIEAPAGTALPALVAAVVA